MLFDHKPFLLGPTTSHAGDSPCFELTIEALVDRPEGPRRRPRTTLPATFAPERWRELRSVSDQGSPGGGSTSLDSFLNWVTRSST
jgi:hypothetical protein